MKSLLLASAALALATLLSGCAPKDDSGTAAVRASLKQVLPGLKDDAVRPSAVPGLYEVQDGSNFGYATADGKYLIEGDLVNLQTGESITENHRKADRLQQLAALGEQNMIVYKPEGRTKHVVTVFTDIDCPYCRKLHSQMAEYNAEGIEIRYLSYPRTGPNSASFKKAEEVWCADDRKAALTAAKAGQPVTDSKPGDGAQCASLVRREWDMGNDFGLRGTPLLVLDDGSLVNGYLPPAALLQRIDAPDQPSVNPRSG
ncbi:thioredoxin fold domain-containing protein [Solimonas marina]|uniref:Thiol:disulfide interchange protein n=1 Tax=Solimonas marina TaxID=2714601 RepID=A0A969WEP5_9GAMM|nr:thioredoxin fold domain-containing protein [Solimonas marina]NKF24663.1 thioredoxin fold domain-containing protein [Solimonas marina]